jgi:DNA-binding SARP family transcriptional activator
MLMGNLQVCLFGKLNIRCGELPLTGLDQRRAQELFCYLLLYRNHPLLRETLIEALWGGNPTVQSRKYLRQALWQLNSALESRLGAISKKVLEIEPDWVYLNTSSLVWLDVAEFEQAFVSVKGASGQELGPDKAQVLKDAVRLYDGELLEGYYQDWCLFERERLRNMLLAMLDKLMNYCEAHELYDDGLLYGANILRFDGARERTHRRMMRLHYLAGDRTAALRQYSTCVAALKDELQVAPSERTTDLYQQICAGHLAKSPPISVGAESPQEKMPSAPLWPLVHLKQLQATLASLQQQMGYDIQAIERLLEKYG